MKYSKDQIKRAVRSNLFCLGKGLNCTLEMEDHADAGEILYNYFCGVTDPRLSELLKNPRYVLKLELIQRHLTHNYK